VPKYQRPYIDSSVWLGWKNREVINNVDRYAVFQTIWEAAERGEFKLYTSTYTFTEIYKLRHQANTQPLPTVEALLIDLEAPFVEVVELDRELGIKANILCRRFAANKLYPGDAIHLASALEVPCDALLCYDRPLSTITAAGTRIEEPAPLSLPFSFAQERLLLTDDTTPL
jgi:predicted nucleic acid-binding protein